MNTLGSKVVGLPYSSVSNNVQKYWKRVKGTLRGYSEVSRHTFHGQGEEAAGGSATDLAGVWDRGGLLRNLRCVSCIQQQILHSLAEFNEVECRRPQRDSCGRQH